MHFEHLIEINNPLNPLIEPLSVEQVWQGLMYRVEEPTVFLPGLERCTILSRQGDRVERELHFGPASVRDTVTFRYLEWVCFGELVPRDLLVDQPAAEHLYLRFTYETTLPDGMEAGEGVQVSEYVKAAYRESDLDTVRIIRLIAANGRPQ